jgi:hypothetical protein
MTFSKIALAGLVALALAGLTAPALAQELCINAPAISLTDTTTDNEEALQRIDALGNRCVRSRATGEQITRTDVIRFLESDPDARDVDYGALANQLEIYD